MAAAALHPPAAGGKTAWGVGDMISKTGEDSAELKQKRKAAAEFNDREQARLHNLKEMDKNGQDILESRRARKQQFEQGLIHGADDFKSRQLEILAKLEQNKNERKLARKEKMKEDGTDQKVQMKKNLKKFKANKKNKKKKASSSSSSGSSGGSSSNSSSSSSAKEKEQKQPEKIVPKEDPKVVAEREASQKAAQLEAKHKAEESKARQREVTRKAKEQLAAHEAETKKKQAEEAAKRVADTKKKTADLESKKKEEVKQKKEEEKAKKQAEEDKKNTPEIIARRKAAEEAAQSVKAGKLAKVAGVRDTVAGGYCAGQHVKAAQDITIRGTLIVRNGTAGTILGKADTDPVNRIAVKFVPRADGGTASINCVPKEIKKG